EKLYHMTLNRLEKRLMPAAAEARWCENPSSAITTCPSMKIMRRENNAHHQSHDGAWVSGWQSCGNPYYISEKENMVHLSTCASGPIVRHNVDSPPYTGCMDYSFLISTPTYGDMVMRYVSLSLTRLRVIVNQLTTTISSSSSSSAIDVVTTS